MKSFYRFLTEEKSYSDSDAQETIIRWDNGMVLPENVLSDVYEFLKLYFDETLGRVN